MNTEDFYHIKWYAVPNDLIGGFCIRVENTPPSSGGIELADFMDQKTAQYIVELHNRNIGAL